MQRTGRARVDPQHPEAFGVCDRDGMWYNLRDLFWQFDWRGPRLMNLRIRVCRKCLDQPSNAFRTIIYPPDPVPVADPRPQNFAIPNNGSPFAPPLPWPVQAPGPPIPGPYYLLDDNGNIMLDDSGYPMVTDNSPPQPPPTPVYVTPPLPPLPEDIEGDP